MPEPQAHAASPAREVVLHIGTGKAGSTSIQAFCRDNREELAQRGLLYPTSPGRARHAGLSMSVKSDDELAITPGWQRRAHQDPERFRRRLGRRLRREVEESGQARVLLSDEELFGLSDEGLHRLADLAHRLAEQVRVVVYLRRQDDHMISRYQQGVKIGWVARLQEWARTDFSALYDYDARLRRHERLVAPDRVVVRRFESAGFAGGSLHQDFLDAVGVAARADEMAHRARLNESLDAETVEFLRLLNLYRVEHEGATAGLIDNRALVRRLAEAADGPALTLPEALLDRFMLQWRDSNRRVAEQYLGDPTGKLFREPRKTTHTTSRQLFDPARLDHFLALADLPDSVAVPLRGIAAREALGGPG